MNCYICIFYHSLTLRWHRYLKVKWILFKRWNTSLLRTRTCLSYIVNLLAADDLWCTEPGDQQLWCRLTSRILVSASARACFLALTRSKLRLCLANHKAGYFSNLTCDWLSMVWAHFEQETENGPWLATFFIHNGTQEKSIWIQYLKMSSRFLKRRHAWYYKTSILLSIIIIWKPNLVTWLALECRWTVICNQTGDILFLELI